MPEPQVITSLSQAFDYEGTFLLYLTPPATVSGAPTRTVALIGEFERGPIGAWTKVTNSQTAFNTYGRGITAQTYKGMLALLAGKWGGDIMVLRIAATAAVKATSTGTALGYNAGNQRVRIDAKNVGVWGNSVTGTIAAGSIAAKKYTIIDTATGRSEEFDNRSNLVAIPAGATGLPLSDESLLVTFTAVSQTTEPDNVAATALVTGANGTVAGSDYTSTTAGKEGIVLLERSEAKDVSIAVVAEAPAATDAAIMAEMKLRAENVKHLLVVVGAQTHSQTISAATTDAGTVRSGYLVYTYGYWKTRISGLDGEFEVPPQVGVAACISNGPVHHDITTRGCAVGLSRATAIVTDVNVSDYKTLRDAGVVHIEQDSKLGIHPAASVINTTQKSQRDINWFRTIQYIGRSLAEACREYQGLPRSKINRAEVLGACNGFMGTIVDDGGTNRDPMIKAFLVRDEGVATATEEAQGLTVIDVAATLLSTMRHVVFQVNVGTTVNVAVMAN